MELEEKALKIRSVSHDVEAINDNFISAATELEADESGTLNLLTCKSSCACPSASKLEKLLTM